MKNRTRMSIQRGTLRANYLITLLAILTLSSCGSDDGGGDSVTPTGNTNVRIVEVNAAVNEVTLQNFGEADADLSDYWFCLRRSYVQLNEVTISSGDLTLSEDETVTFSIEVNDAGSDVSVYNASAAFTSAESLVDFMQFNGSYTTNGREDVAVAKGIWTAGEFVEGATTFTYNGDGSQTGASQWSGDGVEVIEEPDPESSSVRIVYVNPDTDLVTLKNFGTEAEDISGYFFCIRKSYPGLSTLTPVSGDFTLDADEEIQFEVTINDASSDVGIYLNNTGFADAANMIDFMQFGADVGTDGRVDVAVTKGIWTAGEFVDGPAPYNFTGEADEIGASFWTAAASIRIVSINPDTESVTLKNLGGADMDISDYQFCLGPGNYNGVTNYTTVTGDFVLSADEEVVIDLTSSNGNVSALAANGGLGLFSTGSFGSSDPDILRDFVQWGAADQPRVGQAVTAGRWDSADNFVSGTAPFTFSGDFGDAGSTFWGD